MFLKFLLTVYVLNSCLVAEDQADFRKAIALYKADNYKAAVETFEQLAPHAEPTTLAKLLLLSANCYAKLDKQEKLISVLERYFTEFPNRKESRQALANLATASRALAIKNNSPIDFEKAATWLNKQLEIDSDGNPKLIFELADSWMRCQQLENACKVFQRFLDQYPNDPVAANVHYELARINYQTNSTQAAMEHFAAFLKSAVEDDLRVNRARMKLAELLAKEEKLDNALQLYALVAKSSEADLAEIAILSAVHIALESKASRHLNLVDNLLETYVPFSKESTSEDLLLAKAALLGQLPVKATEAVKLYESLAQSSRSNERKTMSLLNAAILADRQHDHERSARNAAQFLKLYANDLRSKEASQLLARSCQRFLEQQNYSKYLEYTALISDDNLKFFELKLQRLQVMVRQQRWQSVVDDSDDWPQGTVTDSEVFVQAIMARATAQFRLGHSQHAVSSLQRILQLVPNSERLADVRYCLATMEDSSAAKQDLVANNYVEFAEKHAEDHRASDARFRAGEVYHKAGKFDLAASQFKLIYRSVDGKKRDYLQTQSAGVLYARCLLETQGGRQEAMVVCEQLRKNNPSPIVSAWCNYLIAEDLLLKRQYGRAASLFLLATKSSEVDLCAAAWYQRASCLYESGDKTGALSAFEHALEHPSALQKNAAERIHVLKNQINAMKGN